MRHNLGRYGEIFNPFSRLPIKWHCAIFSLISDMAVKIKPIRIRIHRGDETMTTGALAFSITAAILAQLALGTLFGIWRRRRQIRQPELPAPVEIS